MLTQKERNDCMEAIKRFRIKKLNKERHHGKRLMTSITSECPTTTVTSIQ